MSTCSNCGTTGGASRTCATKLSEIIWDGGSLCNGYSGTSVNDAILSLAQSICNLNTEWSAFAADSDSIDLSASYVKGCFTAAGGDSLTTWLNEAVTKICLLNTEIAALDGTLVIKYDSTTSTYDSAGTTNYGTLKTYTIPADTFNSVDEYLLIECHVTTAATGTLAGNSNLRISLGGNAILTYPLTSAIIKKNPVEQIKLFVQPIRTTSNATGGEYHGYSKKQMQHPIPVFGSLVTATPLTFTGTITLLIEGYNTTGVMSCDLIKITKFRKTIIY